MPRILVADDDVEQLYLRKKLLESSGHQVQVAHSAARALRGLEGGGADLVLMDLRFPNESGEPDAREGLELIRAIRRFSAAIPVIVLSGWPEEIYGKPEADQVFSVMVKPVRLNLLLNAIREALA